MGLIRPVTRTVISTTDFGQPVYDWITANTPTAWTNITRLNGWGPGSAGPVIGYRLAGDRVYLRGRSAGGTPNLAFAVLPANVRPPSDFTIPMTVLTSGTWSFAVLDLRSNGNAIAYYPPGAYTEFSIDGISYSIT